MKVLVYVEGTSDRDALTVLLDGILKTGKQNGIGIRFLSKSSLDEITNACRQCFAPFVQELRAVAEGRDPDADPAAGPPGAARGRSAQP